MGRPWECHGSAPILGTGPQAGVLTHPRVPPRAQGLASCAHTGQEPRVLLWPECPCPQVEAEAVYRAVTVAKQANCPLYVTKVMSKSAADVVALAKRRGERWARAPTLGVLRGLGSHSWPPRNSAGLAGSERGRPSWEAARLHA